MNNRGSIVLDYNAVINAIPKPWLDWISANKQTTELETDQVTIKKLDQYLKKPTDLLKLIVNKVGFGQYKLHITYCNWNLAKKCTKEIRLLVLHWTILHNIYPTNIQLHRMEISENRNCKFCTDEIDYIEHCGKINLIWKSIEEYAYMKFDKLIKLKDLLFGYNETENSSDVLAINHVILIAKMCISKYRYGKYFDLLPFIWI